MYTNVTEWDFVNAICKDEYNNMPAQAARHLFEYLEVYEEATGERLQLDVVAIRCEFNFYECPADFVRDYGEEYGTTCAEICSAVSYETTLIACDGETFIIGEL